MEKKPLTWVHYIAMGTGISATLAGVVAGGYMLGSFLDRKYDTDPQWTLACVLAALALGIVNLVYLLWKYMRSSSQDPPQPGAGGADVGGAGAGGAGTGGAGAGGAGTDGAGAGESGADRSGAGGRCADRWPDFGSDESESGFDEEYL
ncbi:MAG: AtpZ/AtpI family protein [Peptococcaceae bacterium]|nr:AtpZ/AtpI family protein [Peptococcaceae bacterium]